MRTGSLLRALLWWWLWWCGMQGLLEQGLSSLKLLVREAGAMCPWPGDAAAALLSSLLDMGEKALINRRNWQQLNSRAVDLLQLIAGNKRLQADTHSYRSIMHRLVNTLKVRIVVPGRRADTDGGLKRPSDRMSHRG